MVNWYFKLEKCHNKDTCATTEEINQYIKNMTFTRHVYQASLDFDLDKHINNELFPFDIELFNK